MSKEKKKGYLYILITVLIFGFEPGLMKLILGKTLSPNAMCFFRTFFIILSSEVVLVISRLIDRKKRKEKEPASDTPKKINLITSYKLGNITKKRYYLLVLGMGLAFAINTLTFTYGLNLTKATLGEFVNTIGCAFWVIIVFAIFFKNERRQAKNIWVYVAFLIGTIGVFYASGNTFNDLSSLSMDHGILLILVSGITWAFYLMFLNKLNSEVSKFRMMRDSQLFTLILITIWMAASGSLAGVFEIGLLDVLKIFLFSFIVDIGTMLTYYEALRIISGIIATLFTMSCPIITYIFCFFALGERITKIQLIGCIILFASNLILSGVSIADELKNRQELKE